MPVRKRRAKRATFRSTQLKYDLIYAAPQLILYITLTIVPFILAVPLMFTNQLSVADPTFEFVGVRNFVNIFQAPIVDRFLPAVRRTAVFTVLNYCMVFLFGMPLALLMYEFDKSPLRRPYFVIIYMPFIMSGVGVGMMMGMLFSRDSGSLNLLLLHLGWIEEPIDIKNPSTTAVLLPLLVGWRYAGFNMAIFLSGLLTIPRDTIDAAEIDGCTYLQRFWHVYVPQMLPSILIASIFCMIGSFGVVDEPVGMGGLYANPNAEFLSVLLLKFGFGTGSQGTLSEAVTMSMTVYVPLFVVAFFITQFQQRKARG
jgi:ABC-type sugar transport system permease subunit